MFRSRFQLPSHIAAFVAGAVVAGAVVAHAIPKTKRGADRYATLDTFAQALSYIANNYVEPVDERKLIYGAISGMTDRLDDHSRFLSPRRYKRLREDTEGEFGGVGIALTEDPEGGLIRPPIIDTVMPGSPAARAGIAHGDRLLAINGRVTVGGKDHGVGYWHSRLRGLVGTRVNLDVARTSWREPHAFALVRERVKVPTVEWSSFGDGIGYIAIDRFQEATASDVHDALRALQPSGLDVLILDLRGNPGGILDQAIRVADLFVDDGLIVTIRGRRGSRVEREVAHGPGTWADVQILLLIDRGSASAAEIVAAALQDHGRATVMGVPSFGKGSVQTFIDLADGSGLKLTTAHYYTPRGRSLEGAGIKPDILVESTGSDGFDRHAGESGAARGLTEPSPGDAARPGGHAPEGTDTDSGGRSSGQDAEGAVHLPRTPALQKRLAGDLQLQTAYLTVRQWLGSKHSNDR